MMNTHIPSVQECLELMRETFHADQRIISHCQAVCRVALYLAKELKNAGCQINSDMVAAAALLHDLAKGEPNHPKAGGDILKKMGYFLVAEIVEVHEDISICDKTPVSEKEIVFLADKFVLGDQIVSLESRFQRKIEKYGHDPAQKAAIETRRSNAIQIKKQIENIIGKSLETILATLPEKFPYEKDLLNL